MPCWSQGMWPTHVTTDQWWWFFAITRNVTCVTRTHFISHHRLRIRIHVHHLCVSQPGRLVTSYPQLCSVYVQSRMVNHAECMLHEHIGACTHLKCTHLCIRICKCSTLALVEGAERVGERDRRKDTDMSCDGYYICMPADCMPAASLDTRLVPLTGSVTFTLRYTLYICICIHTYLRNV